MTKYKIYFTNRYIKDIENIKKRKEFNPDLLKDVLNKLANGIKLDNKHKDHKLRNSRNYSNCRECHITNDWLLVYRIESEKLLLVLLRTGSHNDLF